MAIHKIKLSRQPRTYFEEEVEPQESAAGDDGEAGGISAGDGFRHVRRALQREGMWGRATLATGRRNTRLQQSSPAPAMLAHLASHSLSQGFC